MEFDSRFYDMTKKINQDAAKAAQVSNSATIGLLSCPFCGGEASILPGTNVDCMTQDNRPAVGCANCCFTVHKATRAKARDWWNTRAR